MYRSYFGMTQNPFIDETQPEQMFETAQLRELTTRLDYLSKVRGIGLITGEVGSGKTSAVRRFSSSLHEGLYKVVYVCNTTGNVMDLYKSLAMELGLEPSRNRAFIFYQLKGEIRRLLKENKRTPVVIVDEAQLLRNDVLEELRLLMNFEMDSVQMMVLVLIGQPELRRKLCLLAHEPLSQRILVRFHMEGMEKEDLVPYLEHQLKRAAVAMPLFDGSATQALFQATKGVIRKVNKLAHHALLSAASRKSKQATAEDVQKAFAEIQ